jgi:Uma2 family endonuclease
VDALIKTLVHSPNVKIVLEKVNKILLDENKKRIAFYSNIVEGVKNEFINGEVIFQSPVKLGHNNASFLLATLINTYVNKNRLGFVGHEKILTSFTRNDYEPDICFFNNEKSVNFYPDKMQFPPPDFIVEVLSPSTETTDRKIKFKDYEAHGVSEYWIVDPETETVEQYILRSDKYELILKSNNGNIKSEVLKGFEIPVRAIFNTEENLQVLKNIIV